MASFWWCIPSRCENHCNLLCTSTKNSSWEFLQLVAGQLLSGQPERPLHHKQNHTCRVTLLQPARRGAVLGQPSSLRPHWWYPSLTGESAIPFVQTLLPIQMVFAVLYCTVSYTLSHLLYTCTVFRQLLLHIKDPTKTEFYNKHKCMSG